MQTEDAQSFKTEEQLLQLPPSIDDTSNGCSADEASRNSNNEEDHTVIKFDR